jgi:hypothetical protein
MLSAATLHATHIDCTGDACAWTCTHTQVDRWYYSSTTPLSTSTLRGRPDVSAVSTSPANQARSCSCRLCVNRRGDLDRTCCCMRGARTFRHMWLTHTHRPQHRTPTRQCHRSVDIGRAVGTRAPLVAHCAPLYARRRLGYVGVHLCTDTRLCVGAMVQYIVDSHVFLVGASGGVYALVVAHMANVILVCSLIHPPTHTVCRIGKRCRSVGRAPSPSWRM